MMQDIWTVAVDPDEADDEEYAASMQRMVSAGQWSFEGSVGRAMDAAIEAGLVVLGPTPAHDYWGNRIPSRYEVVPGTKGSIDYANDQRRANDLPLLSEESVLAIEAGS